jgi:hypothetical protein
VDNGITEAIIKQNDANFEKQFRTPLMDAVKFAKDRSKAYLSQRAQRTRRGAKDLFHGQVLESSKGFSVF